MQGETLEAIMKSSTAVAEGVLTSRSADALAHKLQVDCPIINGIFRVLHGQNLPSPSLPLSPLSQPLLYLRSKTLCPETVFPTF